MKRFFNSCGRYRRDLCLLAGGVLPAPERDVIESHLAACADCRKYYDELKAVTVPLGNWEENFSRLQPDPAVQRQWARAIQAAGAPGPVRWLTPAMAFRDWWQDVVWSSRRIWAGLVAVWVVLLVVNFSGHDHSPTLARKSSPPSPEMIMTFRQQERLLTELIGSSGSGDVEQRRTFLPKPRTERMEDFNGVVSALRADFFEPQARRYNKDYMNETSNPDIGRHSFSGRFFRWLFSRRMQKRALIGLAALATLVAIFYTEENWRGKRAWEQCKRDLEAKGAVLDWEKFIPPPVPDDRNFFTFSTNILVRFKRAQTDDEFKTASNCQWLRIEYSTNSFPVLDSAKTGPVIAAELVIRSPDGTATEPVPNNLVVSLDDPSTREKVPGVIQSTVGGSMNGAAGFKFSARQLRDLRPARIVLQAKTPPALRDLEYLISTDTVTNIGYLRVETTGARDVFQVLLTGVHVTAAADYLKWSDQFEPAFNEVREALKRPYALLPGDYSRPYAIPIANFVTMRAVAQMLAQRAQCHLLLGEPDQALREMTLMHDLCRILEKPPTGKPMTLVEAMINGTITGLYVNTIVDGFRLSAWQAPQLTALQEQLRQSNLLPPFLEALRTEPSAVCRDFEIAPLAKLLSWSKRDGWSWPIPRGWIYQNMANLAELHQKPLAGFDPANNTVSPRRFNDADQEIKDFVAHKSPYRTWAALGTPNYLKAMQTIACNQTMVNEAQIACALERYRLAHGEYPETLDALAPQFIEKLPHDLVGGQPLHYRRTDGGKFLLYSVGWNETDDGGMPENII